jgi:BirA family transcriptional regulator, biotin operon repressor / biotin---[acetyl-CoA-carboxylase] ligase
MKNDSPLADIRIGQITHQWAQAQKIKSVYSAQIESTNSQAKSLAFAEETLSEHLVLYVAERQNAGRGRGQNSWTQSAVGSQLLSTWSFMIDQPALPTLSPQIGLGVFRAAQATWPFLDWNLKAPNDLYIDSKKVAGLLIETVSQGDEHRLLIGFGMNVISSPESVPTATSIVSELAEETPLLAEDWISFLERLLFEFSFSLQLSYEPLNTTTTASLLVALNQHPLLKEKYTGLDSQGNLSTESRKISWTEL